MFVCVLVWGLECLEQLSWGGGLGSAAAKEGLTCDCERRLLPVALCVHVALFAAAVGRERKKRSPLVAATHTYHWRDAATNTWHSLAAPQEYARLKEEAGVKTAKLVEERTSLAAQLEVGGPGLGVGAGNPAILPNGWARTSRN